MKKKTLFVAQNMAVGGIQTSLLNLLATINKDEYEIDLFTFCAGDLVNKIPDYVNVIEGSGMLNLSAYPLSTVLKGKKSVKILTRIALALWVKFTGSEKFYRKMLKKHITDKKYDVAISYFNDVPTGNFNKGSNMFVSDFTEADIKVTWVHNDPIKMGFDAEYCKKTYKAFDYIMCVSKAVKAGFDALVPEYKEKTRVFYNVFDKDAIVEKGKEYTPFEKSRYDIVTVCRIDNVQKRVDGIIKLCKRLKDADITGFKWRIVGGGPDMDKNSKLIKDLGVSDLVEFCGEQINPYPYIKNSDIFALYSAYEGFPMVIGEAIALGTKIITTNYAAAEEQVKAENGIICENDELFYEEITRLILEAQ